VELIKTGQVTKLGAVFTLLSLSACGWVDSTGGQPEAPLVPPPPFINPSLLILDEGESFSINENTQRTVAFSSSDSRLTNWSWRLLDGQANIENCQRFADFDLTTASNSLTDSCTRTGSCEIELKEQTIDNVTRFSITAPQMRAPAALEFQFTARNDLGESIERRQLLCAIPINEAPNAVDDEYTITRGTYLSVSGDDAQSLLDNDSDDDDVRNQGLRIITTAVEMPSYAANFELFSDGGFIYEPVFDAPLSNDGSISDRFVYSVTDGHNTSTATAKIQIVPFNTAPVQLAALPEIRATITDWDVDITFFNLRYYFSDIEDEVLNFTALEGALPESGNVYLTNEGLLIGNPQQSDSGRYFVTLSVADGIDAVESGFYLNIVRNDGSNTPPNADDIRNKTVEDTIYYDTSTFFSDDDLDHLSFTSSVLPQGVEISPDGVIYGTSTASNRGRWFIRVTANDGNGGTVSDGFLLRIR